MTKNKANSDPQDNAWREMGLKDHEYQLIVEQLGREPNFTELGMFAVLWSEHCGYKHSKNLLKELPVDGPRVLVGPGENAGVIDIGGGLGAAFKIESHNHPSAVEPYHGAATGAGGIVRDILAMGARPAALVGSTRFGPLTEERNRFLFRGVSEGMVDYGNVLGVPTVAVDLFFAEPYTLNPLCNVMCLGILSHEDLHKGQAAGVGNIVMIVGHSTGRDGIHGCTFASEEIDEAATEKPPTVQGDPDMEKRLIEACLEMMSKGAVVGIQDMGAAGIASSSAETAARAGTGIAIETARIPVREEGMTPYEILLSESQERMLLIVTPEKVDLVKNIGEKWGLNAVEIGVVTESGNLEVMEQGVKVADVPARLLTQAPVYDPESKKPDYINETYGFSSYTVDPISVGQYNEVLLRLLASPNIASKDITYSFSKAQASFDEQIAPVSVEESFGEGVLIVNGTGVGLVLVATANGRFIHLNPRAGTQWAVAEAARRVAAVGGSPCAISNCLNFGNPEKPEIFWQLKEAVEGMGQACAVLETPVTGGNVSLYNETGGESVYPTPVIGMVGVIDNVESRITPGFKEQGHRIAVLGSIKEDHKSLSGSEYLSAIHQIVSGDIRSVDLELEKNIIALLGKGAKEGLFDSAQSLGLGGLGVALAKSCISGAPGANGAEIDLGSVSVSDQAGPATRPDLVLFGEANSAVVVSFGSAKETAVMELCRAHNVPFHAIGHVTSDRLCVEFDRLSEDGRPIDLECKEMDFSWRNGIAKALGLLP